MNAAPRSTDVCIAKAGIHAGFRFLTRMDSDWNLLTFQTGQHVNA